ncbi:hypothetical protein HOLleu_39919 [Holothuria leucospilota]|uniref:Uncharacterized protein n=1 Tax=Holothuria leucospilota TaxID=206669 RepID=A0A9Q0YCL2_HOLLE|nr:hypothetical protein HOLleu_39919 [Holothuria leucospilota]
MDQKEQKNMGDRKAEPYPTYHLDTTQLKTKQERVDALQTTESSRCNQHFTRSNFTRPNTTM